MATLVRRGTGTPVTTGTTWATVTNAVDGATGTNPATYATMTNAVSAAVATIEIAGHSFDTLIGSLDTLNSVTVAVRHLENNVSRFTSIVCRAYVGGTAVGSGVVAMTLNTAAHTDTLALSGITLTNIRQPLFNIRVTITGAATTQSRVFSLDQIDVTVDYTPLPAKTGAATATHAWATTGSGKRVPKGAATATYDASITANGAMPISLPAHARSLEASVQRTTEAAVDRFLESFVVVVPNEGTATVGWTETATATGARTSRGISTAVHAWTASGAGRRTSGGASTAVHAWTATASGTAPLPVYDRVLEGGVQRTTEGAVGRTLESATGVTVSQGTATVTYVETTTAAGRKVQKGTAAATWSATVTAAGKRTPKATVVTTHTWVQIAQGAAPAVGIKQGSALVFHAWTQTAAGKRSPKGSSPVIHLWTPSAAGRKVQRGSTTATWLDTITSTGKRTPKAVATATWMETATAVGKLFPKAIGTAAYVFVSYAEGHAPVELVGYFTVGMQWGPDPVVAWQMNDDEAPVAVG